MSRASALSWVMVVAALSAEAGAQTPPAAGPIPARWAILVGVDGYEDAAIDPCRTAASDALALDRWLTTTAGWPADHVLLLTDGGARLHGDVNATTRRYRPSRENLEWAVREWVGSRLKPDDQVLIYFAGQAVSLPTRPDDLPGTRSRDYLLPIDAVAVDLDRSGWSLDAALDSLAERGRNPILIWLDTSANGRNRGVLPASEKPVDPARPLRALTRWPGVSAWMSGKDRPVLEPTAPGEPSLFLKAALDGMGTQEAPATLLAGLDTLRQNPALSRQGFQAIGGLDPLQSLFSSRWTPALKPNGELVVQAGHADRVRSIVFAPDGRWMATGSMDSTVRIWSMADRACLKIVSGFSLGVRSLALAPDGRTLAAGDGAGGVKVWSRMDAEPRGRPGPPPHSGAVEVLRFLPDSRGLVSLDLQEGNALFWDLSLREYAPKRLLDRQVVAVATAPRRSAIVIALADSEGNVHLLRPDGSVARKLDRKPEPVSSLAFAPDASEIAVAEAGGTVGLHAVATGKAKRTVVEGGGMPRWIGHASSGALAIRRGRELKIDPVVASSRLASEAGPIALSPDGSWLATADETVGGSAHLHRVRADGPGSLEEVALTSIGKEPPREIASVAFSPDGTALVLGEASGGFRVWSLPEGREAWSIRPNRRRVAQLAASPDGKRLLQIDAPDGVASVWDLEEGRVRPIPGVWTDGLFLDDRTLLLTESAEAGGNVRMVDHARGRVGPLAFDRSPLQAGSPPTSAVYDKLALCPDRTWLAAGSTIGRKPTIRLWEARTGKPLASLDEDGLDLHAIAISPDGKRLLAAIDARVVTWKRGESPRDWVRAEVLDLDAREPGTSPVATSAAWLPDGRVAVGTLGGRISIWNLAGDALQSYPSLSMNGAVRRFSILEGGEWLAACGDDRSLRVWSTREARPQPIRFDVFPNHEERINALLVLTDGRTLVTGGDDAQARFWSLKDRALLGTLSLAGAKSGSDSAIAPDWVCTTPSGLYDASNQGSDAIRWRFGEKVRTLDQLADRGYYFHRLSASLARGIKPDKPAPADDPIEPITLEWSSPPRPDQQQATLTLTLGDARPADVRLYQGGVPIQTQADFQPTGDPRRWTTTVKLRSGANRFHAMAARPDRIDGRSPDLAVTYAGPDSPPRLHVVALGISAYGRRALQFADDDARALGDFLHGRGLSVGGEPGDGEAVGPARGRPVLRPERHGRAARLSGRCLRRDGRRPRILGRGATPRDQPRHALDVEKNQRLPLRRHHPPPRPERRRPRMGIGDARPRQAHSRRGPVDQALG